MIFSFACAFILPVHAEERELVGGQSTIVNGGFEEPDKKSVDTSNAGYLYTPQNDISGWATTSTTGKIELGWLKQDGTSQHMIPIITTEITSGIGASDGWQFAETIGSEPSTIYQSLSLDTDVLYNWTVHHRGRNGVDTLALFFVKDDGINYVKFTKDGSDHFAQILNWMKAQGVSAPAAGNMVPYTVYTTALQANGAFAAADAGYFSFDPDEVHTVKFEVYLMSTGKSDWGEYTGTYLPEGGNVLFAMSCFKTASSSSTSGNLVDNLSFSSSYDGTNLLVNPDFETEVGYTNGYYMAKAANATESPFPNIGWSTTASDYMVEIGTLRGGKDAYGLGVVFNTVTYNAPSIREGDQFAELNADQESSLYQIVDTDPGKMYKWGLSHRGRSGLDTMALVIGPNQTYVPKKTSAEARDQMMQIVDWLYAQTDVVLDVPNQTQGCSNEIKLYTPKFNSNGGFETNDKIFSWYQDETHTEEWSVWVIASSNDTWHDYGELNSSATYKYEYVVPQGQEDTIFGFVSVNSAPRDDGKRDKTYGNLLDSIEFKEYYYVDSSFDGNENIGHVYIKEGEGHDDTFIFDDETKPDSGWAIAGSTILIHFKAGQRTFIGAYVNGKFVPENQWGYKEETQEYFYLFENVDSALVINVVYQAQQVIYDSRSSFPYQYDLEKPDSGSEVPMGNGAAEGLFPTYTSHAPTADDGWKFVGWKYIDHKTGTTHIFDAVHIVKCSENQTTLSIWEVDGSEPVVDDIPYEEGILFLAEWKYRQRAIAQTFDTLTDRYVIGTDGGTVDIKVAVGTAVDVKDYEEDSKIVGRELYTANTYTNNGNINDTYINVVAKNKTGYVFSGWYDVSDNLVSRNPSYTYKVIDGGVTALYARFDLFGYDITINVSGDSELPDKYYAIDCSFSKLREDQLYAITGLPEGAITFNGEQVTNPTILRSDESGNANVTLYMKDADSAFFVHLPENCVYSVTVQEESKSEYNVCGEVFDQTLTEDTRIKLIWHKAVQKHVHLAAGKHYMNIFSQINEDTITITPHSSYTLYVETQYVPSGYTSLTSSLCFFSSEDVAQDFASGTRILMIDSSESGAPKFYTYTISTARSEIPLTEFFVLGTTSDEKYAMPTGDIRTDTFVFVVDYMGATNAQSGIISLIYRDSDVTISPVNKRVNIEADTTNLIVTASNNGKQTGGGAFEISVKVEESATAINTTYEGKDDAKYAIKLSRNGESLPVGSYVKVDGEYYYCDNGYIKIPSLGVRDYTLKLYMPESIYSQMEIKVTLLSAISTSAQYPVEKSESVNLSFVDGQSCAMRVDILKKVLSLGVLSQIDVQLTSQGIDRVSLTISKKNTDGTYNQLRNDIDVALPADDEPVTIDLGNGLNVESGATYIFSFVGYLGSDSMCFEECMVVGSYI